MECVLVFFTILLLIGATIGAVTRRGSGKSQRRRSYQRIAKRFGARYLPGGLFRRPSVLIPYGTTRAVLREIAAHGPYEGQCTQVQLDSPERRLHCELFPQTDLPKVPQVRRLKLVATNDENFDERVATRSNSQENVIRLATDGLRWQIDQLMKLTGDSRFYVRFYRNQILVEKPQLLRDFDSLETLITVALDLYDQFMLTRAEGIDFVESDSIQALEVVTCTVCGEEVTSEMVYCRRCKTPYHRDCWHYTGGCSVFGCQESQCLEPQTGAPAERHDE